MPEARRSTAKVPDSAPNLPGSTSSQPGSAEILLSPGQLAWRRFRAHRLAMASAVVLVALGLAVVFAPSIVRYDVVREDLGAMLTSPNGAHWFGTDNLGRDELARVLYGGRISLLVGLSVALSAGLIGGLVGALAGYYGGWADNLLMRVTDLFLAIPFLVILIVAARALGGSLFDIVLILSLFFWMGQARIVRGVFLSLREKEFVEAARAAGASDARIILSHMVPNALGPIVVNVTLGVAAAILAESSLSFLGFGIQPPTPSWGNLLNDAQNFTLIAPWLVWFPGLAILITVLAVNFLGDGLRDAFDPHEAIGEE